MSRRASLILAGAAGLALNAGVMALLHLWLQARGGRPFLSLAAVPGAPALPAWLAALPFAILLALALAEIPLMIVALQTLAGAPDRPGWALYAGNTLFVFFAAMYGALLIFITGRLPWGAAIAGTGLLRLLAGALWIRP